MRASLRRLSLGDRSARACAGTRTCGVSSSVSAQMPCLLTALPQVRAPPTRPAEHRSAAVPGVQYQPRRRCHRVPASTRAFCSCWSMPRQRSSRVETAIPGRGRGNIRRASVTASRSLAAVRRPGKRGGQLGAWRRAVTPPVTALVGATTETARFHARTPPNTGVGRRCLRRSSERPGQRAMSASCPPVRRSRSSGASSMSKPRRPPETKIVSHSDAVSSRTVGSAVFWPKGEMPPTT